MLKEIVLKVQINDKTYPISCKEGEEERVEALKLKRKALGV